MPTAGRWKGNGQRTYACEECGRKERLAYASLGLEKPCAHCGGPSYCDPFPTAAALRRLVLLAARIEAEDGPLGVDL